MTTLDDFFSKPTESLHPRLRNWKARLGEPGAAATIEIFRPESELGESQPEINLQFTKDGKLLPLETVAWDDDLNAGLIQLGVRAITPVQEAERFALGLRAAMRKATREFGDGYFNAVLVDLIKGSDLTQHKEIAEVLKYANANRDGFENETSNRNYILPGYGIINETQGGTFNRYTICRELIAAAISERARELTEPLKYTQEEAKGILVSALARFLDERFSVSSRRRFGLL